MYFKIMEYLYKIKGKIKPIPVILRGLALIFLCFSLFVLVAIPFPGMKYSVNGISMTYSEFIKSKGSFIFLSVGIICPICGYSILSRKKWGRYIILLGYIVPALIMPIVSYSKLTDIIRLIPTLLFSFLVYWYLFLKESVRNYYENGVS